MPELLTALEPFRLQHPLPASTVTDLQALLVRFTGDTAWTATESTEPALLAALGAPIAQFSIALSPQFSALLLAEKLSSALPSAPYSIYLTFDPEAIATTLTHLSQTLPQNSDLQRQIQRSVVTPQPNDAQLQSQFTLQLMALLAAPAQSGAEATPSLTAIAPTDSDASQQTITCITEPSLYEQIEQERLLLQVTTQIQESLDLPVILQTAVQQARRFLGCDRLIIYQMQGTIEPPISPPSLPPPLELGVQQKLESQLEQNAFSQNNLEQHLNSSTEPNIWRGRGGFVAYEAKATEAIPSVLNLMDECYFAQPTQHQTRHQQGVTTAIADVEVTYAGTPCLVNFLRQAKVRAKLMAPIWMNNQLWGFLVAHECEHVRQWRESEQRFLRQIAEHLAIAIHQAQLYAQVQQQKQTLEQRVIERTQELQDVMQAAQAANRAKSEFLATVTHELRTPLTCIIGMSQTLQRWSQDSLKPRQQSFLQMIHDSGEQLLSIINDILDLSQAESGKMVLNLSAFSLSHLAQQTLKVFEGQAALQEVKLELEIFSGGMRDRFTADARRVQQILFNLLSNAIKFTPAGGEVTLRVFQEGDCAIFQVQDTGIGIAAENIPLLFQKFQQLDAGYQRQYEGTGLGLALTQQLVDLHGGWISVESTPGIGSLFTVRLPLQIPDENQPDTNPSVQTHIPVITDQPRGRIVLVEPDEDNANLICDILTAAGFQLVWILESSMAIDQIEVLRPFAVIMNLQLPELDGLRLLERLQQNPATKQIKVIVMVDQPTETIEPSSQSGTQPAPPIDLQASGITHFLTQPIRPDLLLQKVLTL
ncbi:MAG: ATP-binding protein [Oculatellaceae cyanobacterium Prado106]|jgi:two-component system sensor histidine kinase/response regulator|nr:ATP-binding protein [Oculatellaceae cyanobacterium Prado106]